MTRDPHRRPRITLVRGDITEQDTDAIVNAANSTLLGGGGVDGAIHARGGPEILAECRSLRETRLPDGLPAGSAVTTTAGRLRARRVIHTVGPVWHGGARGEAEILASAWRLSLECARAEGLRSVAFPSISTGVYGYPVEQAADVALRTVTTFLETHGADFDEVRIVLFSGAQLNAWSAAMESIEGETQPGG